MSFPGVVALHRQAGLPSSRVFDRSSGGSLDALGCRPCERNPESTQWLCVTPVFVWA